MQTKHDDFWERVKGKLIVSSQALENEPLHGASIMARMAKAAELGGAAAIRANSVPDIQAIQQNVDLPIIGLIKRVYPESDVYITPTKKEADQLIEAGVSMIAMDATRRPRPSGEQLEALIRYVRDHRQRIMADVSTVEEGCHAAELGVDCVSTTLSGYTAYSRKAEGPDFDLIGELAGRLSIPVIAEGNISSPEQARRAIDAGAFAVVVGSAITRPQLITQTFVKALLEGRNQNDPTEPARQEQTEGHH